MNDLGIKTEADIFLDLDALKITSIESLEELIARLSPQKKWVSVDSILKRLKDARTSQGYKDNYYAIETKLERGE